MKKKKEILSKQKRNGIKRHVSSSKNLPTFYHWISGSSANNIKAKNMKDACIKAILDQLPAKPDKYDKEELWFNEMKVVKGKLPKYW